MMRPTECSQPVSRLLSEEELDSVSGAMKWDHNYVSKNVIDARGGQAEFMGWTFTFDINGNISSASRS